MSEKFLHRNDAPFSSKVREKIDETVASTAKSGCLHSEIKRLS